MNRSPFSLAIVLFAIRSVQCYHQPKLSFEANWSLNATTFATQETIGQRPTAIFITLKNKIYVANRQNGRIVVWYNGSSTPTAEMIRGLIYPDSLSVTSDDQVYVSHSPSDHFVERWTFNGGIREPLMRTSSPCSGLFLDKNNKIYCSMASDHRVIQFAGDNGTTIATTVAGTGCPGPVANMLDHPHGIFLATNSDLYVADTDNNRIQSFVPNDLRGKTVAGFGSQTSFPLEKPTSVVLDCDDYLFIVESVKNRIVRSLPDGFRCLVGCSTHGGTTSSQLHNPQMMAFDSDGNIFVTDTNNHRIQKFFLISDCEDSLHECRMPSAFFESGSLQSGDARGWILGGGSRSGISSNQIKMSNYLPSGSPYNLSSTNSGSSIVNFSYDPKLGSLMPNIVYSGNYSWRIGDLQNGGKVAVLSQRIDNYNCSNIFFVWLAVFETGHTDSDSPLLMIELQDRTLKDTLPQRHYYGAVDSLTVRNRFSIQGSYMYTPKWQVERFRISDDRIGHSFRLNILAADCSAGAHLGYVYLDDVNQYCPTQTMGN